jgi:hypothetical protein
MSPTQLAYAAILKAVEDALANGVNVFIGGDPAVVQVTKGMESYTFRTVPTGKAEPPSIHEYASFDLDIVGKGVKVMPPAKDVAVEAGFTGNTCFKCGSMRMKLTGTCAVCLDCGESGGCS